MKKIVTTTDDEKIVTEFKRSQILQTSGSDYVENNNISQTDLKDFISFAENNAQTIHREQYEYGFYINTADKGFIKRIKVPESFVPLFETMVKAVKQMEIENGGEIPIEDIYVIIYFQVNQVEVEEI